MYKSDVAAGFLAFLAIVVALIILIAGFFGVSALSKKYGIWSKEQKGRAMLAEAKFSKQVAIEEAKANLAADLVEARRIAGHNRVFHKDICTIKWVNYVD